MTSPLRVDVNLTWLATGRVGGSEEYLVRQLAGLPDDGSFDLRLLCQSAFADAHAALVARYRSVVMPGRRDRRALRIAAEHTWLAAHTRSADLVHHGGGTAPLLGRRPIVLTVHDLQYRQHPEHFGRRRLGYLESLVPRSVARAEVVVVPSEFVRGTVIDAFGARPERVLVVPHGVPEPGHVTASQRREVLARYDLTDRPFVIYPAITHPHKGHRVLIEMLAHLDPEIAVVLIGGPGEAEDDLQAAIAASRWASRIVRTGRVAALERDALIAAADVMVFPSEYEGFGAPLVEAMALDTPVVCSDAPAVVEVVGSAGIVVSGKAPEAWAEAVRAAIGSADRLIELGRQRRLAFTPEISGRALAAAYRQAAAS